MIELAPDLYCGAPVTELTFWEAAVSDARVSSDGAWGEVSGEDFVKLAQETNEDALPVSPGVLVAIQGLANHLASIEAEEVHNGTIDFEA